MTRYAALGLILIALSATAWAKPEATSNPVVAAAQSQDAVRLAWDRVGSPLPLAV